MALVPAALWARSTACTAEFTALVQTKRLRPQTETGLFPGHHRGPQLFQSLIEIGPGRAGQGFGGG